MKRLITFLLALLLTWIGASAQVDYSYLINTGTWTRDAGDTSETGVFNSVAYERYGNQIEVTGDDPVKVIYQTLTGLPNGTYEVTFYAVANNAWVGAAYGNNIAQVFANTTVNDVEVYDQTGVTDLSVYEHTLTCTVTDGTLEYGLQNVASGGNWYVCQGISLYSTSETPTQLSLSEGDVVESESASSADEFTHWIISGPSSGEFALNTWSTEGATSGMVVPFFQYWIGSGSVLGAATIRHYQLGGLPAGLYTVTLDARAFDENSLTEISEGTIFIHANDASVDITTGTHNTFGEVSAEVYGTYTLVAEVTDAGTLDINITVAVESACDWLSWKNLSVVYDGESLPDLEYVEGDMNSAVEEAMKDAVDAYNKSKDADDYTAALAAIAAAEESVAQYAEIAAVVEKLDEAGAAVWANTTTASAYNDKTLTTSDDINEDLAAAQKAQTTEGSDMSYVLTIGTWAADQGNGPSSYNSFAQETYIGSGEATSGKVLYCTVEGLQQGTYTLTFYAAANMANGVTGDSGSGISVAYATNATSTSITVGTSSAAAITSLDDMTLYTVSGCKVIDGELQFGIENVADGGNWFLCAPGTLTLESLGVDIEPGDEVHSCKAEVDHWTIAGNTNGDFHQNTWSSEADASGMVTPFLEYWVDNNNGSATLSDATISHEAITGLTAGYYEVSLDIRIFSEAGNEIGEGTTFNANTTSEDLVLGKDGHDDVYGTETEVYGTYTIEAYVDEDGTLDISLSITDATYNWISFKNLKVAAAVETSISWEMTDAGWGTMIIPFDAEIPSGLTLYAGSALSLGETDEDGNTALEVDEAATSIAANVPYLVSGSTGTYTFAGVPTNTENTYTVGMLTGTLVDMTQDDFTADSGQYVLQNHVDENGNKEDDGLAFYPIMSESTGVTLDAYHCYLTLDNSTSPDGVRAFISLPGSDNEETGIVAVESETLANDVIYDLSGRRVAKAVKGVYIQNGKKVLVK